MEGSVGSRRIDCGKEEDGKAEVTGLWEGRIER